MAQEFWKHVKTFIWRSLAYIIRRGARPWQPFCFSMVRVIKFATEIQATNSFVSLHCVIGHGRVHEFVLPFGAESINGSMIIFASCLNFRLAVGECARVGGSSIPGREAEKYGSQACRVQGCTLNQRVGGWLGIVSCGPAVVHCKAWASALRVALSGAHMDPM